MLGRLAMAKGDAAGAKKLLIASVAMPEKYKTATLEPSMALAQEIYDSGDRATVLAYLEASRGVWKYDRGRIDRMIGFVKKAPMADLVQLSREYPGREIVNRPAPSFDGTDAEGNSWKREQLSGKVVTLEFGDTPVVDKVSKDLQGVVTLKVSDEATAKRFEVNTKPTFVVIDRKGEVVSVFAGEATEADARREIGRGMGETAALPPNMSRTPAVMEEKIVAPGQVKIAWEEVENAESYLVEWDTKDEKGWVFDRDQSVRVIPTKEPSAVMDVKGFLGVRWRVASVPKYGRASEMSGWREIAK